jgi:hypothetical protein
MFGCQDNPSFMQYIKAAASLIAHAGYDGVYIDWTKVHGGTCFCDHSKNAFRKYLSEKVPADYLEERYSIVSLDEVEPPIDNTQALWREWLMFRSWSLAESHRQIRAAAREVNPNFLFAGNINGGAYGNMAYTNGDDMELMGAVDDFLYSEIQSRLRSVPRDDEGIKISNSGPLKFLAAAAMQKPVWMYCIQPSTPNPIPVEESLFNLIKLNIAEAFANHNSFSVVRETFGEPISPYVHNGAEEIYRFFRANEPNLVGAKLAANVAIFCSINQFYSDEFSYFNPASRMLADDGIAHVMTVERDFNPVELANYEVLILPYVPLMSDRQIAIIEDYVQNGGGLVMMGLCASKNEHGLPRRVPGFSDLFGFDRMSVPGVVTQKEIGEGRIVYIPLNPLFVGRGDTRRTPLPDDQKMYGRGEFPAQIAPAFSALAKATKWAADGALSGELTAPAMVEFTTMRQDDLQLVHFVNYKVTLQGAVTPAQNVRAKITLPSGKEVRKLTAGSPKWDTREIDYTKNNEGGVSFIEFSVPTFEIYSLATIYFK